jgi:hypothetical protein
MITFLHTISQEDRVQNTPEEIPDCKHTLSHPNSFLLNSPYTIPLETLRSYLNPESSCHTINCDLSGLVDTLRSFDIQTIMTDSHTRSNISSEYINSLRKKYESFCLESKMKFPYSVNLYSSNYVVSLLKNIQKIMSNLNFAAYLSNSKYEIDRIIFEAKDTLQYELSLRCNRNIFSGDMHNANNIEDIIFGILSPYTVSGHIEQVPLNNPFYIFDDYFLCLAMKEKYKLKNIYPVKQIFNDDNILYKNFYKEEGIKNLLKTVLTYKSNDIIFLYIIYHYLTNLVIEYVLQFTHELHAIAHFIYSEIEQDNIKSPNVYIPQSIYAHFRLIEFNNFDNDYSHESENMNISMKQNVAINDIDENYKQKWAQLQKTYIKIFKVGTSKLISKVDSLFFKKYYGRIPHLYKQYSRRAMVVENTMTDDPGRILATRAVKYIDNISNDATDLFNQLLQIARRISSVTNIQEKINIVNGFCKKFKIDKENPDSIKNSILNEVRYRIASSILQDNEIYGFTVDGILLNKKFPPANHIVTSLFVKNPHERPQEIPVSDIFSDEKNILLFAHPEQILKFNTIYKQSASKIIDTFNPKIAGLTEKNMTMAAKKFSNQIMKHGVAMNSYSMKAIDPKEQKKISDQLNKTIINAIDIVILQKRRCLQCVGIAHDMIRRVTELAKRCVVSMLNVEASLTDLKDNHKTYYNSGNSLQENKRINKKLERNKQHIENKAEQ